MASRKAAILLATLAFSVGLDRPEATRAAVDEGSVETPKPGVPLPTTTTSPPREARIRPYRRSLKARTAEAVGWHQTGGLWTSLANDDGSEPELTAAWACIHKYEGGYASGAHAGDIQYGGFRMGSYEWKHAGGLPSIQANQATPAEQYQRARIYHDQAGGFGPWATKGKCGL